MGGFRRDFARRWDLSKKIRVEGKGKVTVDRFMSYGFDPEYIACSGPNIYFRLNDDLYIYLCRGDEKTVKDPDADKNGGAKKIDA